MSNRYKFKKSKPYWEEYSNIKPKKDYKLIQEKSETTEKELSEIKNKNLEFFLVLLIKLIPPIILLVMLLILTSCSKTPTTVTYVVFYPNYNDTNTVHMNDAPFLDSDKGSNYLKEGSIMGKTYYIGSASIKIISKENLKEN